MRRRLTRPNATLVVAVLLAVPVTACGSNEECAWEGTPKVELLEARHTGPTLDLRVHVEHDPCPGRPFSFDRDVSVLLRPDIEGDVVAMEVGGIDGDPVVPDADGRLDLGSDHPSLSPHPGAERRSRIAGTVPMYRIHPPGGGDTVGALFVPAFPD